MFHKNQASSKFAVLQPQTNGIRLVNTDSPNPRPTHLPELIVLTCRRCASFFAEAAVLVLVFGILDYFLQKGRIELSWIIGALAISVALLAASIGMDFGAHRWTKAHP